MKKSLIIALLVKHTRNSLVSASPLWFLNAYEAKKCGKLPSLYVILSMFHRRCGKQGFIWTGAIFGLLAPYLSAAA